MLCNPEDAAVVIQENMTFDTNSPNFAAVKSAFENKYESMDLDCTDVAGLIDDDGEHLLKSDSSGFRFWACWIRCLSHRCGYPSK